MFARNRFLATVQNSFIFLIAVVWILPLFSQSSQGGIQPFGTYKSQADQLNLGNLSVHYEIPLFSRKERGSGTDVSVRLVYDAESYVNGFTVVPDGSSGPWHVVASSSSASSGHLSQTFSPVGCPSGTGDEQNIYYTYSVTDSTGYPHYFPGNYLRDACTHQLILSPLPQSDGLGYQLISIDPTAMNYTIATPSGSILRCSSNGNEDDCTTTDTNGNSTHAYWREGYNTFTFSDPASSYLSVSRSGINSEPLVVEYKDSDGNLQHVTVAYQGYSLYNPGYDTVGTSYFPATVTYPDNSSYSFSYEASSGRAGTFTGRLSSVKLPTGGTISYSYTDSRQLADGSLCGTWQVNSLVRTTADATTTYANTASGTCGRLNRQTTGKDGNSTKIYNFVYGITGPLETSHSIYSGNAASGTPLETITRCYNGVSSNCDSTPVESLVSQIVTDSSRDGAASARTVQYFNASSLPTEVDEYDYGATTPTRKTITAYATLGNYISDRIQSQTIKDANDNIVGQVIYGYDESSVSGTSNLPNHVAVSGSRGNQTSQHISVGTGGTLDTNWTYDDAGQIKGSQDGLRNWTYFAYDTTTDSCLISTTYPIQTAGHSLAESYTCNGFTGARSSSTDLNGNVTTYKYDSMLRSAGHSITNASEVDISYRVSNGHQIITDKVVASPSPDQTKSTALDGYGRVSLQTQADGASIATSYNYDGHVHTVSNPYFNVSDATYGETIYDPLGRVISQQSPSNTAVHTFSYSNNNVTETDERQGQWMRSYDALHRLTKVVEPGGASTMYSYDLHDNLTSVIQDGGTSDQSKWLSRTFTYDLASRLLTSTNPETGTVCYGQVGQSSCANGYDANGNLLAKTDARGRGVLYTYDALNRLKTKAYFGPGYQDGAVKTYYYDGSRADGGALGTGLNQIGRLSSARSWAPFGNGLHDEYQSYDAMGRVTGRTEVAQSESGTGGHAIGMSYDLAGNLTSLTYPDGRVVTQSYDSAGRLSSVKDGGGQKYVSSVSYFPNGMPQQMLFNNDNMAEYTSLNSRLQVCETKIGNGGGPGTLFDRQYFYGSDTMSGNQCNDVTANNGNLMHVLDSMNSNNSQHYAYDSLNRLTHWNGFSPAGTVRQQSFGYDSFGNMAQVWSATAPSVTGMFDEHNRLVAQTTSDCLSYDAAGNLTCTGTQNTDAHTYGFNEEGELVLAWVAQNSTSNLVGQYSFDSSGTRVRADNPTAHTWREYTYLNGQVLAEKDNNDTWIDHIYANGKHLAMVRNSVPELHVHGQRDAQHVNMGCGTNWWTDGMGGPGYTVRNGDRWFFRHKNAGAVAGMQLQLADGSFGWQHGLVDQNGVGVELLGDTGGAFATRVVDLNPIAGMTISRTLVNINNQTPAGTYDVFYREASIVSADGTVTPIFNGQAVPGSIWGNCGVYNQSFGVEPTAATDAEAVTYYAADQVGTIQMEFSSAAWPVARNEFAPFGQQLDNQLAQNRFRFTGKERDTESGLDYFGARYYNAGLGRFMSPDWSAKAEPIPYSKLNDPQTLNLYSYVGSNPLTRVDLDGHDIVTGTSGVSGSNCSGTMSGFIQCDVINSRNLMLAEANIRFAAQQQNANLSPMDKVAMKAEAGALKLTRQALAGGHSAEYGGLILKRNADGSLSATAPIHTGETSVDIDSIAVPRGYTAVGEYHTHPSTDCCESEGPSTRDINRLRTPELASRIGYVGSAFTGEVRRYTQREPITSMYDTHTYGTVIGTIP